MGKVDDCKTTRSQTREMGMIKENDNNNNNADNDGNDDKDISVKESTSQSQSPPRMEKVSGCNDNKENSTESKTFKDTLWGTKRIHTLFMTSSDQKGVRTIRTIFGLVA